MPRVIPPAPARNDEFFWTGVGEHRLLARRCAGCGYLQHPPPPLCPACGSAEWTATDLEGTGAAIRSEHDAELAAELSPAFLAKPAAAWFAELDAAGVPCEISDADYALRLFADAGAQARGLTASFRHRMVGQTKMAGLGFDLSGTPAVIKGGPLWPGQDSKKILADLGYTRDEIAKLIESKAVDDTSEV